MTPDEENSSLTPKETDRGVKSAPGLPKIRWADKRRMRGKPQDIENQEQVVRMQDRITQPFAWEDLEDCLKKDDSEELKKMIKSQDFKLILRSLGAPAKTTPLHRAAELGSIKCMNFIIKSALENAGKGDFSVDSPDHNGETPLFLAVRATQIHAISTLINANASVNSRDDSGCSVLHIITSALSKKIPGEEKRHALLLESLDIILDHPDIDVEARNNLRYTPLIDAAERYLRKPNNSLVLLCKRLVQRGASLEARNCEKKCGREILDGKPFLDELIREQKPSKPRPFLSQFIESLMLGDNLEPLTEQLKNMNPDEATKLSNSYFGRRPLLFVAVKDSDMSTVDALLTSGANSWKKNLYGELCLHTALSRGNPNILDRIIGNMKEKKNLGRREKIDLQSESFALVQIILENHRQDLAPKLDVDHLQCLVMFLKDVKVDVNACEEGYVNQSLLHLATSYNNHEAAKLFLEKGAFLGSRKIVGGEDRGTVLKVLRPETIQRAMDCCIVPEQSSNQPNDDSKTTEDITGPDYTLDLNYQFLVPPSTDFIDSQTPNSLKKQNEVKILFDISKCKHLRKIIKHPLIQTFLYAKWRKVLPLYLLNLILYLSFVILLTMFMYSVKDLRVLQERRSVLERVPNNTIQGDIQFSRNTVNILKAFLIIFTIYILAREIFQVIFTLRDYLKDFENYLEWLLIIIVAIFCFAHSFISVDLTRHLAAWAMIIAWYEFVLLLGRAPPLAIYVTMLRHVSWNFLKLIFLYGALILAFSVSFNIILQPTITPEEAGSDFSNFWSTLPKSIVMATGEFEYSELSTTFFSSRAFYATSAVLVFLVFVFLIFLVLMNVMSGLAVTDTQQVMEEATLYSLKSRLELIYLIEEMLRVLNCTKLLSKIHLISDSGIPHLSVRVNHAKDNFRIIYGGGKEKSFCKLDDDTAEMLRSHRLQQLTEESERARSDPTKQCLQLLKELNSKMADRTINL